MSIKDAKKNYVVETAKVLFLEKSISSVTLKDIADTAGIGEATVYRYFKTRAELVIECAMSLQSDVSKEFSDSVSSSDGYGRLKKFYGAFLKLFVQRKELYRFLNEFDAFCITAGEERLNEYSDNLDSFKTVFDEAYSSGIKDGSVRPVTDPETFYYSTTHSLLLLCKKHSTQSVFRQDKVSGGEKEIKLLIDMILSALKSK